MRKQLVLLWPSLWAIASLAGGQENWLPPRALAVLAEFDRLARQSLWPGFEPDRIALEFVDGRQTWLVRHPQPPPEFASVAGHSDIRVFPGRHESVRANSSIRLAGVPVATAFLQGRSEQPEELAALLLHEVFHVFQSERHATWGANEADLFLYPTEDSETLALRRLESEALRRGLAARRAREASAWAARAIELRQRRFARLPAPAAAYERGTEVKEGLARYVEAVAIGVRSPLFPDAEFPAAAIRERGYASGCAMALLLDRLHPAWKRELEEKDEVPLDELLARAVTGVRPVLPAATQEKRARRLAVADVAGLRARRASLQREFLEAPGWRVIVEAGRPLFPQGFDPLNLERLSAREVLHTRWVKLSNDSGSLEVLDRHCLTEGRGEHPLFQGVQRVTITGLASEPRLDETADSVKLSAAGLAIELRGARLARSDQTVTITVP